MIEQGDVYWVDFGRPWGSEPGYRHPAVVIQNDAYNQSRIGTTVVCMLTSNTARARSPGNIVLRQGEAGLPKRSVAIVTQIATVDRGQLREQIGRISKERISEILQGVAGVLTPIRD